MQICFAPLAEFKRKNCNTARIEITRYFYHETSSPVRIVAVRYINGYKEWKKGEMQSLSVVANIIIKSCAQSTPTTTSVLGKVFLKTDWS